MRTRGILVSFEGCEGCGKTTQADLLSTRLNDAGCKVVRVREPGGTRTGEVIRGILQHDSTNERIEPETESLLFAASRAQMVRQVVVPALEHGEIVVSDRFVDSAVAYQGYGRQMGADVIATVNRLATGPVVPDITFLLDIAVAEGMRRMQDRNVATGTVADRMEREDIAFHERVRAGYLEIAERNRARFVIIDATRDQEDIAGIVWSRVQSMI